MDSPFIVLMVIAVLLFGCIAFFAIRDRTKKPTRKPTTCTITDVQSPSKGVWVIEYESTDGKRYLSKILQTYMNGEVRPAPQVGDKVSRIFAPGSQLRPPSFELGINGHWFKHHSVGTVEGII